MSNFFDFFLLEQLFQEKHWQRRRKNCWKYQSTYIIADSCAKNLNLEYYIYIDFLPNNSKIWSTPDYEILLEKRKIWFIPDFKKMCLNRNEIESTPGIKNGVNILASSQPAHNKGVASLSYFELGTAQPQLVLICTKATNQIAKSPNPISWLWVALHDTDSNQASP